MYDFLQSICRKQCLILVASNSVPLSICVSRPHPLAVGTLNLTEVRPARQKPDLASFQLAIGNEVTSKAPAIQDLSYKINFHQHRFNE